jgi:hypothetical protein
MTHNLQYGKTIDIQADTYNFAGPIAVTYGTGSSINYGANSTITTGANSFLTLGTANTFTTGTGSTSNYGSFNTITTGTNGTIAYGANTLFGFQAGSAINLSPTTVILPSLNSLHTITDRHEAYWDSTLTFSAASARTDAGVMGKIFVYRLNNTITYDYQVTDLMRVGGAPNATQTATIQFNELVPADLCPSVFMPGAQGNIAINAATVVQSGLFFINQAGLIQIGLMGGSGTIINFTTGTRAAALSGAHCESHANVVL